MKNFFVSYTADDREWAEWIAWTLEAERYEVEIQAWDFGTGNWVLRMNEAMARTERTIAVLSPAYFRSKYTPAEWADAFRRDPRGERDLLIPVRIAPVELEGIFANLAYVDLVGLWKETDATERLLRRVRGERGKPSTPPAFPGVPPTHTITAKPPYPAKQEDTQRLVHARELLVQWRNLYAKRTHELREAATKARAWVWPFPKLLPADTANVLALAAKVAGDLRALPVSDLVFAKPYGLAIHAAVFEGMALGRVKLHQHIAAYEPPDAYTIENAARVLEAALHLLRFPLDELPQGYVDAIGPSTSLGAHDALVLVRQPGDPVLHLMPLAANPRSLGGFAARNLILTPLCARRNGEGTVDVVAEDAQFVYVWSQSEAHPSAQYQQPNRILAAAFESPSSGRVVTIDTRGRIRVLREGRSAVLRPETEDLELAAIWFDPLAPEEWYAIALSDEFAVESWRRDGKHARRATATLWDKSKGWNDNGDLTTGILEGFPCLIACRASWYGTTELRFLDPVSLQTIRDDLFFDLRLTTMKFVSGRWLVAFVIDGKHRIALFDLKANTNDPASRWLARDGDVYEAFVTHESPNAFELVFVLHLHKKNKATLCRFRWPEGSVEELTSALDLRVLPVPDTPSVASAERA
ncbi:MAG TPA: toll/interleukin-1 receptor domain-containing protein [Thermoanaerobaculia bacterium]|nr:toll/interleukin-1 receptor domain-containing protein [Thermoanaerobaculia bacterium]